MGQLASKITEIKVKEKRRWEGHNADLFATEACLHGIVIFLYPELESGHVQ